jgi:hypothetical protein
MYPVCAGWEKSGGTQIADQYTLGVSLGLPASYGCGRTLLPWKGT